MRRSSLARPDDTRAGDHDEGQRPAASAHSIGGSDGKHMTSVLITGGTGGLGRAVVAAFVTEGWRTVTSVRPGKATQAPAGAIVVETDLTDPAAAEKVTSVAAGDAAAPLRAVINTVGGYGGSGLTHETPVDAFEDMIRLNLRPTYLVTAAALPHLVAAGGGSVVCVSSRAAVTPFPGAVGYVTGKAAVLAFANTVAVEYRKHGVRCNTVLPSVIDTPANRAGQPDADPSRWVSPDEIARVVLFLASDASAPTSGAAIPVYGRA
jgi:NAD(P)-dependent dehydrogenase (short-subunit alcohol dehydrogenase family)